VGNHLEFKKKRRIKPFFSFWEVQNCFPCKVHFYLPFTPIFKEVSGGFAVVLRKFQVPENLESLELNDRQKKAIEYLNQKNKITNNEYRKLFPGITDRTVLNDLRDMVKKEILVKVGKTKNTFYQFRNNSEIIPK
jgi:ATP-dependent DNA helicase RecG